MKRLTVLVLLSCAEAKNQLRLGIGGSGSAYNQGPPAVDPLQSLGAAIGSAAVARAAGGCVATCAPGTKCNEATGLCEEQPCRDLCKPDELCENNRCVPILLPGLKIQQKH